MSEKFISLWEAPLFKVPVRAILLCVLDVVFHVVDGDPLSNVTIEDLKGIALVAVYKEGVCTLGFQGKPSGGQSDGHGTLQE